MAENGWPGRVAGFAGWLDGEARETDAMEASRASFRLVVQLVTLPIKPLQSRLFLQLPVPTHPMRRDLERSLDSSHDVPSWAASQSPLSAVSFQNERRYFSSAGIGLPKSCTFSVPLNLEIKRETTPRMEGRAVERESSRGLCKFAKGPTASHLIVCSEILSFWELHQVLFDGATCFWRAKVHVQDVLPPHGRESPCTVTVYYGILRQISIALLDRADICVVNFLILWQCSPNSSASRLR